MSRVRLLALITIILTLFTCLGCGKIEGPNFPYVASPRALVHTPASPAEGNITITFQLIDREREQGTVALEYSTDNGQTFSACTLVNPAEAANLDSAWYPGKTHTVQWNSVADNLALSGDATVCVRVTPSDASNPSGTAGVSGTFTVNNIAFNQPPSATVATPAGVQFGNIPINYFLSDAESDTCSIVVQYSTNDGANWNTATMGAAGEGLTGLSSSPGGTAHTFLWDSRADNVAPASQLDTVKVKITPTDFHAGTAGETNSFSVDNSITNDPPTVTITGGPAEGSTVSTDQVTFNWSGSDTDGSVIGYYYSFDHDPPDVWTTDTSVTSGVLSEGSHTFRVVAVDDQYDLSAVASRTFTVSIAGVIQAGFTASPTSGAAPLTVYFTDQSTATNGISTWSWTFGDGGTSTAQNPNYEYSGIGTYTVSLAVTGPDGSDTETKVDYITVTAPGPSGLANSAWPVRGQNERRTSTSPYFGPQTNRVEWTFTMGWGFGYFAPAIDENGVIYSGCWDSDLHAVKPDGTINWKYTGKGNLSPCIALDGTVYWGGASGKSLVALDPTDGSEKWYYDVDGTPGLCPAPVVGRDGTIYVASGDGGVYAIRPNGTLRWRFDTGSNVEGFPAIADDGTIYAGNDAGVFFAINPNGTEKWRYTDGSAIKTDIVIADDATIYYCAGGALTALYPSGSFKWSFPGIGAARPSVAPDGTIISNHNGEGYIAIHPDGTEWWQFYIGSNILVKPAIGADGIIYVGSWNGIVHALNPDGAPFWTLDTGGVIECHPCIGDDGTLYIGSNNGKLWAIKDALPTADFTVLPSSGDAPLTVNFTDASVGVVTEWLWNFGDGETSTQQNPTHIYTTEGTYTVSLSIKGPDGSTTMTKRDYILVTPGTPISGYYWTHRMGGSSGDYAQAVCTDADGNVYVAGNFEGTVNFAADWGGSDTKDSAGRGDISVTKIDSAGSYCWTRRMGGSTWDYAEAICTDADGNVYLAGYFEGTVNFAADWGGSDTKDSAGECDIFVTKIDSAGSYCWTRRMGGSSYDKNWALCTDADGNVYVAGSFYGSVNFVADWGGSDVKNSAGACDIFVTKIDSAGSYCWTRRMGGSSYDLAFAVCTDSDRNVYVAGSSRGTVNFAADWGGSNTKDSAGECDIFVTKIDSAGSYCWTRRMGGSDWDEASAVCTDSNGNVYVAGNFRDTVNFAGDWGGSDTKDGAGEFDIFVTKIDSAGSYCWTHRMGGSSNDYVESVCTDTNSNVYMAGYFEGTVDFAEDWPAALGDTKISRGEHDAYIMIIDSSGDYVRTAQIGGTGGDWGHGVAVSSSGKIYVTGEFDNTVNFSEDWFGAPADSKTSAGSSDIFITKITQP